MIRGRPLPLLAIALCVAQPSLQAGATPGDKAGTTTGAKAVRIEVAAGWAGVGKIGRWLPVRVTLDNRGDAVDGELVVACGRSQVRHAVALAAPARKRLDVYLRAPEGAHAVSAQLVASGRIVARVEAPVRLLLPDEPLIPTIVTTAEGRSGDLTFVTTAEGRSGDLTALVVGAASLPRSWRGYDAVDRIEWDAAARDRLDPAQTRALARWTALADAGLDPAGDRERLEQFVRWLPRTSRVAPAWRIGIGAYAISFALLMVGVRRLTSRPAMIAGATVALAVGAAAGAWTMGGRAGGPATVREFSIVRVLPGGDATYVTTYARVEVPARATYRLQAAPADAWLARVPGEERSPFLEELDEGGRSIVAASLPVAGQLDLVAEGFADTRVADAVWNGAVVRLRGRSHATLQDCRLGDADPAIGVARGLPSLLHRVRRVESRADVMTCALENGTSMLERPAGSIASQIRAVLVYHLPPSPRTSGG